MDKNECTKSIKTYKISLSLIIIKIISFVKKVYQDYQVCQEGQEVW